MNIFYLARNPRVCAQHHCDKHVVKMILETAQVLSAVHNRYGLTTTYKATHMKHPSTLWAGDSDSHYRWLLKLGLELCDEYTIRYNKVHSCYDLLVNELSFVPKDIPCKGWTPPPQCMPDEYKGTNTIKAYRDYYLGDKIRFAKWSVRKPPTWWRSALTSLVN